MSHDAFISYSQAADGEFGAALQRGMERLAKPWRKRRALSVFRDLTGLTASPDLWGGIVAAMDDAGWFVLLASPESARSEWVGREIRHWVDTHGSERLLVVVTEGTWSWDDAAGRLDLSASSAAHPALDGVFTSEPRHMDMSWARGSQDLTLRNSRFREQVAELVAPIRGSTKDELVGEDVRQQRATVRRVWGTSGVLAVLTAVALVAAGSAVASAGESDRQRVRAEDERARADDERARAREQEELADEQRELAEEQRRLSDSRRLAALSRGADSDDGAVSRLLALEAFLTAPTTEAREALADASLVGDDWFFGVSGRAVAQLVGHEDRPVAAEFSPDGRHVATLDQTGTLRVFEVGELASPVVVSGVGGTDVAFSRDSQFVAVPTGTVLARFGVDGADAGAVELGLVRANVVAPYGSDTFVVGGVGGVVTTSSDGGVAATTADPTDVVAVGSAPEGRRVVAGTANGDVVSLDSGLVETSRWQFPSADPSGRPLSPVVLAVSDDAEAVVLPPDGDAVPRPLSEELGQPDRRNAIAGIYDAATGEVRGTLENPWAYLPTPAQSADFAVDDEVVMAVSRSGLEFGPSVANHDGDRIVDLPLPTTADLLRLSPDGRHLLVAGDDVTVTIVERPGAPEAEDVEAVVADDVDDTTVEEVCLLAGRNLAEAEWLQYLPDREYEGTCDGYAAPYVPEVEEPAVDPVSPSEPSPDPAIEPTPEATTETEDPSADLVTQLDPGNGTYDLICFGEAQLQDGVAEKPDTFLRLELLQVEVIDMDGNGVDDAVLEFLCTGASFATAVVVVLDGTAAPDSVPIGQPMEELSGDVFSLEPREVRFSVPIFREGDPNCCPSAQGEAAWNLQDGEWVRKE